MEFIVKDQKLICKKGGETLLIEPWGKDALRVRSTMLPDLTGNDWALSENVPASSDVEVKTFEIDHWVGDGNIDKRTNASIRNGRIRAEVNFVGIISFYRDDELVLREFFAMYDGTLSQKSRCLKVVNREWKGIIGGDNYRLNVRFEANKDEKIFGMGQYQYGFTNLKGAQLELAQRNSQISVPFALSSRGYGFLWNNPAVGQVSFAKNVTEWVARSTSEMDYWITVADTPKEILKNYTDVTGRAPEYP